MRSYMPSLFRLYRIGSSKAKSTAETIEVQLRGLKGVMCMHICWTWLEITSSNDRAPRACVVAMCTYNGVPVACIRAETRQEPAVGRMPTKVMRDEGKERGREVGVVRVSELKAVLV